jgi:uncharacterized protein (TIGR03437 family)
MTNWRALALLTLFYVPVLAAQTAPNWTRQIPQNFPSARVGMAMAYDSASSQAVLFGGIDTTPAVLNDTWVWDGSNWTLKTPQTMPPARLGHAMAYDSAHGQVVLFGGFTGETQNEVLFNDTWVWDGSNWTKKSPQTSPSARIFHAMAYDAAHGQVVLFGGLGPSLDFSDTWVWDGANWTQKSPQTSPSPRDTFGMAYDSAHGQVVLFGGEDPNTLPQPTYSDTWAWDGANWTQESPETIPLPRYGPGMAYDSAHGEMVMFGGFTCGSDCNTDNAAHNLSDTWLWDGSNWAEQFPQTSPSARSATAMAYDSAHDQVVLFGGSVASGIGGYTGDTWTWFGGPLPPTISGVVSASDFGGFPAVAPGSWVEIYGSALAPDTQGWTGADFTGNNAPTMLNGVSVSIGGQAAFVDYISATQINAQLPSNIATGGPLQLTVSNANGTSTSVNVTVNATEPGLLAPTSFQINGKQYVVAQHSDGSYVLPVGAIAGVTSSPAKPGETIVIYGVGFGSVTPSIPAGEIATETNQLAAPLQILFGKTPAKLPYYGLAPNFVGLYQFNVTAPAVANNDLVPLSFNLGGVAGTQTLYTAVNQ